MGGRIVTVISNTVIIMEMSQQDRMHLLFIRSPKPCEWDSDAWEWGREKTEIL